MSQDKVIAKVVSRVTRRRRSTPKKDSQVAVRRMFSLHDDCMRKGRELANNGRKLFKGCPKPGQAGSENFFAKV